ncbi:hypothetical protein QYM36_002254, partial [Artemia franciscana]
MAYRRMREEGGPNNEIIDTHHEYRNTVEDYITNIRWNKLIGYNVGVMACKSMLQLPGCIAMDILKTYACGFVQVTGMNCFQPLAQGRKSQTSPGL